MLRSRILIYYDREFCEPAFASQDFNICPRSFRGLFAQSCRDLRRHVYMYMCIYIYIYTHVYLSLSIYIYIIVYIRCCVDFPFGSAPSLGSGRLSYLGKRDTPSPPTKSFPTKSPRVEVSGRPPIKLYRHENSHPLELRVCLSQTL